MPVNKKEPKAAVAKVTKKSKVVKAAPDRSSPKKKAVAKTKVRPEKSSYFGPETRVLPLIDELSNITHELEEAETLDQNKHLSVALTALTQWKTFAVRRGVV